jgi:hypothetical protein
MKSAKLNLWQIFSEARDNVPAYRKFLEAHTKAGLEFVAGENWSSIPIMDKKSYLHHSGLCHFSKKFLFSNELLHKKSS